MNPDGGADMAANAWPGFVDILSAVVIMFVFFVLVTAAALYFHTITYSAKVAGQSDSTVELGAANDAEIVEQLERENQQLREEIESARAEMSDSGGTAEIESPNETQATRSFGEQSQEQNLLKSTEEMSIVLFHDPGAITVTADSENEIIVFIEQMINEYGAENVQVVLTSPKLTNAATQTRAKRLAVARMLNVRNVLLETALDRKNIEVKVVESEIIDESSDWTRFQINVLK